MGFLRTFFLLFRKDLIVARRAYFWTLFQLGLPIAIGLLPYAEIIMKLTTNKELKEMISKEQEESSVKYFGVPLSTKRSCKDLILNYTIDGDENSAVEALLEKAKYLKRNRFDTVDDMLRNATFSRENLPRHSFVFETLTNSTLKYRIITQQLHIMAHDMFTKVFSEEIGGAVYGTTLSQVPDLGSPRIDLLNFCVLSALTEQPLHYKGPTMVIAKVSKGSRGLRKSEQQLKMVGLLFFLLPVLLDTARNIASEKESGIKEFLLVMGLSRVTLFLEALAFSCLKTFLCIAALIIQPLNALPSESRPLFVASCLMLGALFVLIAMICAAVTTSGSGALALAAAIFMILFLHMYWGPDIFFIEFTTNLHHVNGFLCYYDIIHGFELFQLRGQPASFGNMFLYSDIFNPGRCVVFLIIDVIALVTMVVVLEHIPVAAVISRLWSPFGKCQLQRMGSCTPVESWHERMEGRDSEPVVDVTDVSKVWETTGEVAVNSFSMKAFLGEVTVLLGHNGAGKSTVYSMICGTTPMTSGSIKIFGESITRNLSACRSSMGLCPQSNCIFKYLTVDDHLWFFFELKKGSGLWKEEAELLCTKLSITHIRKKVASNLSGGEKRKLCIAQAFMAESQLVILDEPTAGLDPKSRRTVEEFVEVEKNRRCILLSTHYMDEAETMGDFMYIMFMGRSICCGSPLFLKQKFASGYLLNVAFTVEFLPEESGKVEEVLSIIKRHIVGAEMVHFKGRQLRVKLPKQEHMRFSEMFAELEMEEERCGIDSFGLSLCSLEEVLQRVSEIVKSSRDPAIELEEYSEDCEVIKSVFLRALQQLYYIFHKRLLYTAFSTTLIITQIVVPLVIAATIATQAASSEPTRYTIPDLSFNRMKKGRFLIYDPYNETSTRGIVERYLMKYPHIKVERMDAKKVGVPLDWPWFVGGAYIVKSPFVKYDSGHILWFTPLYINHATLSTINLISDIMFRKGKFQTKVSWELISVPETASKLALNLLLPLFMVFAAAVFISSSVVSFVVKERCCGFRHQQSLTGISPSIFWTGMFVFDVFMISSVSLAMALTFKAFGYSVNQWLIVILAAYCASMVPLFYIVSSFLTSSSRAQSICIFYQVLVVLMVVFQTTFGNTSKDQPRFYIQRYVFPPLVFLYGILGEISEEAMRSEKFSLSRSTTNMLLTKSETFEALAVHGFVCFIIIILLETSLKNSMYECFFHKQYNENISTSKPPSCSSDRADIKEEKIEVEQKPKDNILRVQGLTKYYGKTCVLKGTTYGVRYSDCFGLVGASGAGKTTTFAIITGSTLPNSGLAILGNRPVHGNAIVGYCPQFDSLLGCLSAFQNMEIVAGLVGYRHPRRKVREILHKLGLSRHCSKCYSSLSGGQKRRISVGVAMLSLSPCLILDEPTAGIDPEARRDVWKLLDGELDEGRSLLLSSHSMEECEAHCSRIGVLCRGRLIAIGDSQTLKNRHANKFVLHVVLTSVKDRQHVVAAIAGKFPDSTLITKREDVLNLKWHIMKKESDRFHVLYDSVQHLASSLPVHDFCLTEASLEDVFIILNQKYDTE